MFLFLWMLKGKSVSEWNDYSNVMSVPNSCYICIPVHSEAQNGHQNNVVHNSISQSVFLTKWEGGKEAISSKRFPREIPKAWSYNMLEQKIQF